MLGDTMSRGASEPLTEETPGIGALVDGQLRCINCGTSSRETPMMRRGPDGGGLAMECAIAYKSVRSLEAAEVWSAHACKCLGPLQ